MTSPTSFGPAAMATGSSPSLRRGFARVNTWVFDLDNTLYPPHSDLWPQIDQRIALYLCEMFGIDGLSARALQKHWYSRYGTTLKALMDEYDIDAEEFLSFAHQIDRSRLEPRPLLSDAIGDLPGRKLIFTNGSRQHALDTARALGIERHFEAVFDIAEAGFEPKPRMTAYRRFLDRHGVDPQRSAMFEDLEKNLQAPHELGMTTVLVVPSGPDPHREDWERKQVAGRHVDWVTADLPGFLADLPA
jgi:putative hydrolase of the HAD superfamily